MFGFSKKKKPANALDEFIFALYGNPPPKKRAKLEEAINLAHSELLLGIINKQKVIEQSIALNAGPVPYSTHDLALSVALHFFQQSTNIPSLSEAQLMARLQALQWLQEKLVAPLLVHSFEEVLYKLYKP